MPVIGKVAVMAGLLVIGYLFSACHLNTPEGVRPAQIETAKFTEQVEMDAENLMPVEF